MRFARAGAFYPKTALDPVDAFDFDRGVGVVIAVEVQHIFAGGGALKIQAAVFQANQFIGVKSPETAYPQRNIRRIYSGGQTTILP
jgi:hypothetical protein